MDREFSADEVVLIFPTNIETWRKKCKPAQRVFYRLIKIICKYKRVILLCNNVEDAKIFSSFKNVELHEIKSNDSWARDVLPFKVSGKYVGFDFNGYNGILKKYDLDAKLGESFCKHFDIPFVKCDLVLEGGGIVSNGEIGIITEELLFNRNPLLSKEEIETKLKNNLKLKYIIWLKKGLYADETCGHADEIVAFKSKKEILLNWTDDETDKNYLSCRENYDKILNFCKDKKTDLKIYKIIGHKPIKRKRTEIIVDSFRNLENPVAISYINFLQLDNIVILPQFGVKSDKLAYKQFKEIYKDYKIIKFNTREISLGGGGYSLCHKNISKDPLLFSGLVWHKRRFKQAF